MFAVPVGSNELELFPSSRPVVEHDKLCYCWTFHPNSMYHSVMLSYLQEEHVSCQCTFGSRLHEEREKVDSLCECSEGSFLTW